MQFVLIDYHLCLFVRFINEITNKACSLGVTTFNDFRKDYCSKLANPLTNIVMQLCPRSSNLSPYLYSAMNESSYDVDCVESILQDPRRIRLFVYRSNYDCKIAYCYLGSHGSRSGGSVIAEARAFSVVLDCQQNAA